jgi:hypothetical protein
MLFYSLYCSNKTVFSTQDLGTLTSVNLTNPSTNGWKVATVCVHVHAAVHYGDLCGDYNGYDIKHMVIVTPINMCNGLRYIMITYTLQQGCDTFAFPTSPCTRHQNTGHHISVILRRFPPLYHHVPWNVPRHVPPLLLFCSSPPRWLENEGKVGKPASTVITLTKPVTPPPPVTPAVSPAPAPSTAPPAATPSPSVKPPPVPPVTPPAAAPSPEKSEPMPIDNDAK